jgi:hypothetical protein
MQNQGVVEIGVVPIIQFNIFIDVQYNWVKIVGDKATLWVSNTSLEKSIKKLDVHSIQEEWKMLIQAMCLLTSLNMLNLRFSYFYTRNFFIRGFII